MEDIFLQFISASRLITFLWKSIQKLFLNLFDLFSSPFDTKRSHKASSPRSAWGSPTAALPSPTAPDPAPAEPATAEVCGSSEAEDGLLLFFVCVVLFSLLIKKMICLKF